jgi:hypothetical protein
MGLDMYLYKKSYVLSGEWIKEEARESVNVLRGGSEHPKIKSSRIKYVIEEVGYWRKANAIHKWFVDNVQDGKDDCGSYLVTRKNLSDLLNLCKEIFDDESKTGKVLPTQSGFFFGSTDYDEWYFRDIENTIKIIQDCLSDEDADEFEYRSSW